MTTTLMSCGCEHTEEEILRVAGRLNNARRKTNGGGRPRTTEPRCYCGTMPLARAMERGHRCPAPGGFLYFIETADGKYGKIGYSTNPKYRISTLRSTNAFSRDLIVLGCVQAHPQQERETQDTLAIERVGESRDWYYLDAGVRERLLEMFPVMLTLDEALVIAENYHWVGRDYCNCTGCRTLSRMQTPEQRRALDGTFINRIDAVVQAAHLAALPAALIPQPPPEVEEELEVDVDSHYQLEEIDEPFL